MGAKRENAFQDWENVHGMAQKMGCGVLGAGAGNIHTLGGFQWYESWMLVVLQLKMKVHRSTMIGGRTFLPSHFML